MPMVMVDPKVWVNGQVPASPTQAQAAKNYALAGLGAAQCTYTDTGELVSCDIGAVGDPSTAKAPGTWWTNLLTGITGVVGQAYLNNNQAKVYQTNAQGTTVYQQSGVSPQGTQNVGLPGGTAAATGLGVALGSSGYLILGGLGILALVLMSKR
jgi:hypothetical protein